MALEPAVASSHERERMSAVFHMFCKWHGIPVDHAGFLYNKQRDIEKDLAAHALSFESSALLSHSIEELFERFRARFVLLVRRPDEVVNSFAIRNWYTTPYIRSDANLPPTFQDCESMRHFLGRNVPHGDEFQRWQNLTQIGKIAWFWKARNLDILRQFARLPRDHICIQRLEDLDFNAYCKLVRYFGVEPEVDREAFLRLQHSRPNASEKEVRTATGWTEQEAAEFESEVATVATALGYRWQVAGLTADGEKCEDRLPALPEVFRLADCAATTTSRSN